MDTLLLYLFNVASYYPFVHLVNFPSTKACPKISLVRLIDLHWPEIHVITYHIIHRALLSHTHHCGQIFDNTAEDMSEDICWVNIHSSVISLNLLHFVNIILILTSILIKPRTSIIITLFLSLLFKLMHFVCLLLLLLFNITKNKVKFILNIIFCIELIHNL